MLIILHETNPETFWLTHVWTVNHLGTCLTKLLETAKHVKLIKENPNKFFPFNP